MVEASFIVTVEAYNPVNKQQNCDQVAHSTKLHSAGKYPVKPPRPEGDSHYINRSCDWLLNIFTPVSHMCQFV